MTAGPTELLAVLLAARRSGADAATIDRVRAEVLTRLRASEPSDAALADLLSADAPPNADAVLDLSLTRPATLLALAELAESTGDIERYRAAAERLNHAPEFPYFLVRAVFGEAP